MFVVFFLLSLQYGVADVTNAFRVHIVRVTLAPATDAGGVFFGAAFIAATVVV
jgi:hypothetical protein